MGNRTPKLPRWTAAFERFQDRASEPMSWFPFPALVSFVLALLLSTHMMFALNQRLGNSAHLLELDGTPSPEGAIWLAITREEKDHTVWITTPEHQIFHWPAGTKDPQSAAGLIRYLEHKVVNITHSTALLQANKPSERLVVLAVDKRLAYADIKPIIYALSVVGISNYAFEVRTGTKDND